MKKALVGLLLSLASTLIGLPAAADDVTSYAILTDTGLLKIRGQLYRLDGIYVPRISNVCDSSFSGVTCEVQNAKQALESKIRGFVRCVDHSANRDGTLNAFCSYDGDDLGAFLIRNGYAMAGANAPFEYFSLQSLAKRQGRGIWMTLFAPGIQQLY